MAKLKKRTWVNIEPAQELTSYSGKSFPEWFVEVVGMSLLPSFLYVLFLFCDGKTINIAFVLGNGDLLTAAGIVSSTSLLHVLWRKKANNSCQIKIAFVLSLFCVINCFYLSSGVKIGRLQFKNMVGISIILIICAFIASYAIERKRQL